VQAQDLHEGLRLLEEAQCYMDSSQYQDAVNVAYEALHFFQTVSKDDFSGLAEARPCATWN
jgi:hypothetical protein